MLHHLFGFFYPEMLGAEGFCQARERPLREVKRFGEAPAGDQYACQLAALPMRLRVIITMTPPRPREQILPREDRHGLLVLPAQRGLEHFFC
jgi:hypothetical protein